MNDESKYPAMLQKLSKAEWREFARELARLIHSIKSKATEEQLTALYFAAALQYHYEDWARRRGNIQLSALKALALSEKDISHLDYPERATAAFLRFMAEEKQYGQQEHS